VLEGTAELSRDGVARGGYVLRTVDGAPDAIVIATGSELQLAVAAAEQLAAEGVQAQVVSMPCQEWFLQQPQEYRDRVLPPSVTARVAVEAGVPEPWRRFVGDRGSVVGIDHYGASADQATLFEQFGFTADAVATAVRKVLPT
jgi:transketolase